MEQRLQQKHSEIMSIGKSTTRRTFLAGTVAVASLGMLGVAGGDEHNGSSTACLWCGPDEPAVDRGNHAWINTGNTPATLHVRFDHEDAFGGNVLGGLERTKFDVRQADLGGNDLETYSVFSMPTDAEIDIWQSQTGILDGGGGDVYLDVYNAADDTVLFEHGHDEHGNTVQFGDPIDSLEIDNGDEIQLRARNDSGGSVTFSGWIAWSFRHLE